MSGGAASGHLIAIDWSNARFKAYLAGPDGVIIRRVVTEDGVQSVGEGRFQQVIATTCGSWLSHYGDATVAMVGMVGSKGGWVDVPHVAIPAGPKTLSPGFGHIQIAPGKSAIIVPGVRFEADDGVYDVMRGEETYALGTGVTDGIVCVPGHHSKWIEIRGGEIVKFITFVTGELFGLLRRHSFLGRYTEGQEDEAGFKRGLAAAWRGADADPAPVGAEMAIRSLGLAPANPTTSASSLLHTLYEARSSVLMGRMSANQVGTFVLGILMGDELLHGLTSFGRPRRVHVVADDPLARFYAQAFEARGVSATTMAPPESLIGGLRKVLSLEKSQQFSPIPEDNNILSTFPIATLTPSV